MQTRLIKNFPDRFATKNITWYIEAVCQGLTIGFSELLIDIWYSKNATSAISLGIFLTLPAAIGAITQAFATRSHAYQKSPQRLATLSIAGQVLGLALVVFAFSLTHVSIPMLFVGQCLYWIGGMTASSPTQHILSKVVPVEEHNRFFSRRAMLMAFATLICTFISAYFIGKNISTTVLMRFVMIAALARLLSLLLINIQLPTGIKGTSLRLSRTNDQPQVLVSIIRLSIFMFLFRCAVNTSSPFYGAFMLNELNMTMGDYTLLTAIPLVAKTFILSNWARVLDDNKKFEGLLISVLAIGCIPIFWSINQSFSYLTTLQIISGISWAGFDLITILLIQQMYPDSVTPKLGVFLALGSLGSVFGGVLGAALLSQLASYQNMFVISGALRLMTGFALMWYLRRSKLFKFHRLQIRHCLATLVAVKPSLDAAAKLIHLRSKQASTRKKAG
jgi:MFS family permease